MSTDLDNLSADIQNYVVSPLNAFGLGGFVFDLMGEEQTKLESDITDHYSEDNKSVQDHIVKKPKIVTLRGYVGEVIFRNDGQSTASGIVQQVTQNLTELSDFLPQVSAATSLLQNVVSDQTIGFNQGLSSSADIYALVQNLISATGETAQQQKAYLFMKACWDQGILMGIQTPWEFLTNMEILTVTAIQPEETIYRSDFSVTFKQMRFAQTSSAAYSPAQTASSGAQGTTDNLSPLANTDALNAYRSANGMATPPIDKELQSIAATQSLNPVSIGNVAGATLPSSLLSGSQAFISQASDLVANPNINKIFTKAVGQ